MDLNHLWSQWFSRRAWISCAASVKSALSKALREYQTTGQRSADWVYTSSGCHTGLILWIDLHAEGKVSSLNEVIVDLNEFQSYINAPCLQMSLLRTTEIWNLKGKDWLASICVINNGLTAAFKSGIAACLVGCLSFNANTSSRTCTTSTPLAPTLHCHLLSLCNGSS